MFDSTLTDVANQLVTYCREGNEQKCLEELYSADAVSVEALPMPGMDGPESAGVNAIRGKHEWWNNTMEVHSANVEGPYFHGTDRFAVIFEIDATNKDTGDRSEMKEVGIYTVKGGKVVREEFYYAV